ncbi:MAG: hypothetical protein HY762_00190 [Planctomycetes bacterium]|nr:hypothetical protein [Planctomycetota bacterium]
MSLRAERSNLKESIMPYIDQTSRKNLEPEIKALIKKLKSVPPEKVDGHINYSICRILKELYPPSYFNYNRMMGLITCVGQEVYRRLVAPYEDKKKDESGDVF